MSAPANFFDAPVNTLSEEQTDSILDSPFVMARVVGWKGESPLFEVAFGSGMTKEDVPLVVEMLYELFLPEIEARRAEDAVNE